MGCFQYSMKQIFVMKCDLYLEMHFKYFNVLF